MATQISKASSNFTAAGTWAPISTVSAAELDSEAGSTASTTSFVYSSTFTPAISIANAADIDGIAVKVAGRVASPTGTITITLANNTSPGTREITVTINVTDLDSNGNGWYLFKGTAISPNGIDVYKVGFKTSVTGEVTLYRDGTAGNWARMLRMTSAGAAPAAGDKLMIMGEWTAAATSTSYTVTMDNTATTSFGPTVSGGPPQGMTVNKTGTLTFSTSIAAYLKLKGILAVYGSGTLNIGTSGARIGSSSSAILEFDSVTNVDSGLQVFPGGTFNAYGDNGRTVVNTLMTADKAAAATVITLAATTGWANGDVLAFASTTRTASECESKTISTVDSATQVTLTAGLTNAHSGTSPTQAEVVNLTRNVKIRGVSASLCGYCLFQNLSLIAIDYVEFTQMGSATTNKRGITISSSTAPGSVSITHCSLHDNTVASSIGFDIASTASNAVTISNNVTYNIANLHFSNTATVGIWTADSNVFLRNTDGGANLVTLSDIGGTFTNNTMVGANGNGLTISEAGALLGTFTGNATHSGGSVGISVAAAQAGGTFSNFSVWRNSSNGVNLATAGTSLVFDTGNIFGNALNGIVCNNVSSLLLTGIAFSGDSSFVQPRGLQFTTNANASDIIVESCTFGVASGIKVAHSSEDMSPSAANAQATVTLRNCLLASAVEVASQSNFTGSSYIRSQKHDQTAGNHKCFTKYGNIQTDTTIFDAASPSVRLTPNNASNKLAIDGGSVDGKGSHRVAVASGGTVTATVRVRKINENLFAFSQDFDNAYWDVSTTASITANATVAPDGTTTAEKVTELAVNNNHFVRKTSILSVTNGATYTMSCYAKAAERDWFSLSDNNARKTYFNLSAGTVGTVDAGHVASISSVGNGWYRCSITFTTSSSTTTPYHFIQSADAQGGVYLGVVNNGIYLWGAQWEAGSSATTYLATSGTAQPAYNGNQPRLILRKNVAAGISADTVLATAAAAAGSWETLSGTSPAVTDDAVLSFVVDCDGTTGWVNVDTWTDSGGADSHGLQYWLDGEPFSTGGAAGGGLISTLAQNLLIG